MHTSLSEKPKIRPLIKWTGGKYREFLHFADYIPDFENYYEPFFGGGGVFFALQPTNKCFLNDKSSDLIRFYSEISNPEFHKELEQFVLAWEQSGRLVAYLSKSLLPLFEAYTEDAADIRELEKVTGRKLKEIPTGEYDPLFQSDFIPDTPAFKDALAGSLMDKFKRIKKISHKENRKFDRAELMTHFETGVKSGIYLYVRKIMNASSKGHLSLKREKSVAAWYFVRELCYGSMFRFNGSGEFNIPYGGIAYNRKNLRNKALALSLSAARKLLSGCVFANLDFEDFLRKYSPGEKDFVFLDPPYDSDFSKYDNNSFTKDDQLRLRNVLHEINAKWMLVIKETDFIRDIYEESGSYIQHFDKSYQYNMRGRNKRDTRHLIITNYR
jgi:DNA adenine methylase